MSGLTPNDYLRGFSPLKSEGEFGGLNSEFSSRLAGMIAQAPDYVRTPALLESLYRSPEDQARAIKSVANRNGIPFHLGLMRSGIPGMAAPVGASRHQSGTAADLNFSTTDPRTKQWAYENAPKYGIKFPLPSTDSGHAEIDPGFYGPVRPFDLDGGPATAVSASPVAPRSAPPLPIPGSPQMPGQEKDWLGLLSERVESPLFMMGASLFDQAYKPGGNIGAGMMQGAQASRAMQAQRQKIEQQQRRQSMFDEAMAQGIPGIDPQLSALAKIAGPEGGVDMLAKAYRDPLDTDFKKAQINKLNREAATAGEQFGKAGTIVQDSDGKFYSVQFGAGGQKKVEPLDIGGRGLSPSRGVDQVGDTVIDKATGQVVRNVAPNLQNAERVKEIGTVQGKAQAAAEGDITAADAALEIVGSIRNDPNRERGTGASAIGNMIPYTKGHDFQKKVEQAKSGAFLQAIQQLRGMGALSNAEGQTATAAVTRMSTSMTEEGFMEALNDYERVVMKGKAQATKRGAAVQQPQAQQPAPANGGWSMQRID